MEARDTLSLVLFYVGAFVAPLLAGQLRVPVAVGEILFGLLLGPTVLGLVRPTPVMTFLSQLGFAFLMFLVGMEIDFNRIRKEGRKTVALAGGVAAAILGLGALIVWRLRWPPFLALVPGAMSIGILAVATREAGLQRSRFGQLLLVVGSIGEFLTLLVLTGYDLVHRFGVGLQLAIGIGKALSLFAAAYLLLSLLQLIVWWAPKRFGRLVHTEDPSEIGVRAGFVLMLSLAALARLVGLEAILGAFLAGALFSFVFREKGVLETKLSAVGHGFFVPLFFIQVGVSFDARALADPAQVARTVLLLGGLSLLTKLLPSLLLLPLGLSLRQVLGGGLLLSSPLTLLVAIAELGRGIGVLAPATSSAIVLLALLTGIILPTLARQLLGGAGPADHRQRG